MREFNILNSGLSLYRANSSSHASWLRGGKLPVTGRHSVMLRPDSVSRVRPPKTTMPKTLVALARSQYATLLDETSGHEEVVVEGFARTAFAVMVLAEGAER